MHIKYKSEGRIMQKLSRLSGKSFCLGEGASRLNPTSTLFTHIKISFLLGVIYDY